MGWLRFILSGVLGIGLAFLLDAFLHIPNGVLTIVAVSFAFGFENLLRSERLAQWWSERGDSPR
jgi:F0F1-type ATP synthase assembly protein I